MSTYLIWNTQTNQVTTQAPTRKKIIRAFNNPIFSRGLEQVICAFDDTVNISIWNWREFSQDILLNGMFAFFKE